MEDHNWQSKARALVMNIIIGGALVMICCQIVQALIWSVK